MPSCSLSFFFTGYVVHVTRGDTQGWVRPGYNARPTQPFRPRERERETHMYTRTLTWRASSTLPFLAISTTWWKRWARPEPCLVSTSLANLHRQRSYGGRGAVRAGVWTTPLPRKASILPCAAKAAHYTPCCPTFAFPSPRRMTQFSRGLRRSRTDIGAEDGTTTPEGATRTVQRDLGILLARCYSP